MKYYNRKGILYAVVMILAMLLFHIFYYTDSVQSSGNSAGLKVSSACSSSLSASSAPASSNNMMVPSEESSAQCSSAVSSQVTSSQVSSGSQSASELSKVESVSRKYYPVPLSDKVQDVIFTECESKKISSDLVVALIGVESNYNPKLISKTNDYGLMQINICHKDFFEQNFHITNLLDEKQNIQAGVYMLSGMINKYGNITQALMAYNCGEIGAQKLWNSGVYSTDYSRKVISKIHEIKVKS